MAGTLMENRCEEDKMAGKLDRKKNRRKVEADRMEA